MGSSVILLIFTSRSQDNALAGALLIQAALPARTLLESAKLRNRAPFDSAVVGRVGGVHSFLAMSHAKLKIAIDALDKAVLAVNKLTANMPDESGSALLCVSVKDGGALYTRLGEAPLVAAALLRIARQDPKLIAIITHCAAELRKDVLSA